MRLNASRLLNAIVTNSGGFLPAFVLVWAVFCLWECMRRLRLRLQSSPAPLSAQQGKAHSRTLGRIRQCEVHGAPTTIMRKEGLCRIESFFRACCCSPLPA